MLTLRRLLVLGALALGVAIPPATAADVTLTHGNTITVLESPGGLLVEFEDRFRRLRRDGYRVVIDGPCLSACTMVIGMMPGRVCATERGQFGFHSAWVPGPNGEHLYAAEGTREMSRHWTIAVHSWLDRHGGLTPDIKLAKATEFVPACPRGDAGFVIGITTGIPTGSPMNLVGVNLYNAAHPPQSEPSPGKDGARLETAGRPGDAAVSGERAPEGESPAVHTAENGTRIWHAFGLLFLLLFGGIVSGLYVWQMTAAIDDQINNRKF